MSEHTSGPWMAHPNDQGGAGLSAYVCVDAPGQVVARVVCYDHALNPLPYPANARLIAAAPDMLATLQWLDAVGGWPVLAEKRIKAAIAKATQVLPTSAMSEK